MFYTVLSIGNQNLKKIPLQGFEYFFKQYKRVIKLVRITPKFNFAPNMKNHDV